MRNEAHTETNDSVQPLGHNYGNWTQKTAPTCTTAGEEAGTCSRDAAHTTTRAVAALGHNYGNWTQKTAPTCTTAGEETGTCSRNSSHTTSRAIPIDPDAHVWGNWTQTKAPTLTEEGEETRTCAKNAQHTEKRSISWMEMVYVTGGTFTMGSPDTEENRGSDETQWQVTLTGFYLGRTEVTQAQYEAVMGSLPSSLTDDTYGKGDNYPVYYVSWYDALVFCNKLSVMEGLTPAYRIDGKTDPDEWGTVPTTDDATWNAVEIVADSTGYRLPTEAQWEYAARGGQLANGYKIYSGSDTIDDVAWYSGNNGSSGDPDYGTKQVETKAANELGLYDMSGNVWEWCWDWYDDYPTTAGTDPMGASSGSYRVIRGGSWYNPAQYARSARRGYAYPSDQDSALGFRVLRP